MTNKPMLSERDKFEAFWRSTMNVQDMDLHRCEFPMTAYDDQPYACHETERGRITWMARAGLDRTPAVQRQGEPVGYVHEKLLSSFAEQAKNAWPGYLHLYSHKSKSQGCTTPVYTSQPVPLRFGAGVTVENIGYGPEPQRKPYLVFTDNGDLTEVNLIDVSLVSKRITHTLSDLEAIGVRVEQPIPVAVVMPDRNKIVLRRALDVRNGSVNYELQIWQAAIDEMARLNGVKP